MRGEVTPGVKNTNFASPVMCQMYMAALQSRPPSHKEAASDLSRPNTPHKKTGRLDRAACWNRLHKTDVMATGR